MCDIKVGDTITFRAVTRWASGKAKRKVLGFDNLGRPEVRYGGWSRFIVRLDEVLSCEEFQA